MAAACATACGSKESFFGRFAQLFASLSLGSSPDLPLSLRRKRAFHPGTRKPRVQGTPAWAVLRFALRAQSGLKPRPTS